MWKLTKQYWKDMWNYMWSKTDIDEKVISTLEEIQKTLKNTDNIRFFILKFLMKSLKVILNNH